VAITGNLVFSQHAPLFQQLFDISDQKIEIPILSSWMIGRSVAPGKAEQPRKT
jgi:hypothetical protein